MIASACMIVKNEEEHLDQCLKSLEGLVDEIVLIDTGSTDSTLSIAKCYNARIFHENWSGDFSKHRNSALEKAEGDWLFVIDGDEAVDRDSAKAMRLALKSGVPEDVISVQCLNVYGKDMKVGNMLDQIRFFHRRINPQYAGRVHNRPVLPEGVKVFYTGFKLYHFGYDMDEAKMLLKQERRIVMCRDLVRENSEDPVARAHLARALFIDSSIKDKPTNVRIDSNELEIAITDGIELSRDKPEYKEVYVQLVTYGAMLAYARQDWTLSLAYANSVLETYPASVDGLWIKGLNLINLNRLTEGEITVKQYLIQRQFVTAKPHAGTVLYPNEQVAAYELLAKIARRQITSTSHYLDAYRETKEAKT